MTAGRLSRTLAALSDRERWLVMALSLIALPLAVVFLAILPMLDTRAQAAIQAREAAAMLAWVSEQVRKMPAETAPQDAAPPQEGAVAAIGLTGIEDSLVQYALRQEVSELSDQPGGGVDLTLSETPFDLLGTWLQDMGPVWGYRVDAFRIERASPGLVNANFKLVPQQ